MPMAERETFCLLGFSILYVGYRRYLRNPLRGHIIQSLRIIDSLLATVGTCGTVSIVTRSIPFAVGTSGGVGTLYQ